MTLQRKLRSKPKADLRDQSRIDASNMPMERIAAAALITAWLSDNSGYDEAAWPILQADIDANRPAQRPRFHE